LRLDPKFAVSKAFFEFQKGWLDVRKQFRDAFPVLDQDDTFVLTFLSSFKKTDLEKSPDNVVTLIVTFKKATKMYNRIFADSSKSISEEDLKKELIKREIKSKPSSEKTSPRDQFIANNEMSPESSPPLNRKTVQKKKELETLEKPLPFVYLQKGNETLVLKNRDFRKMIYHQARLYNQKVKPKLSLDSFVDTYMEQILKHYCDKNFQGYSIECSLEMRKDVLTSVFISPWKFYESDSLLISEHLKFKKLEEEGGK